MTGVYLFAAAAGVPLVLWFVLGGGDDADAGGDDGGGLVPRVPVTTLAFVLAAFGVCGLLLTLVRASRASTLLTASVAGGVAGVVTRSAFAYLRRSESTTEVRDEQLAGRIGRVVVPVAGERRGRIAVTVGDQQLHLSARALPNTSEAFDVGAAVLVVEVRDGVASVAAADPELA